jgi:hypothetical protein
MGSSGTAASTRPLFETIGVGTLRQPVDVCLEIFKRESMSPTPIRLSSRYVKYASTGSESGDDLLVGIIVTGN